MLGRGRLFALACNLDTVLASVGHGARRKGLTAGEAAGVAGVTTCVTLLSLLLGAAGAALMPVALAQRLGGVALAGLGLWYVLDALRGKEASAEHRGGWLALSAALAVNNAGVGVAAGVSGLSPVVASGCNFAVTVLALAVGQVLGQRLRRWSGWALPVSGALLVVMGVGELI